jgi:mono/diheme cytochrome c family protein
MLRQAFRIALIGLLAAISAGGNARADPKEGGRLARQWCSGCHIVAANQAGAVPQGPPSFLSLARSGMTVAQLRTFLSHPHPPMPDLALTRAEIDNLIDYIQSLR